jgi:ribosome-binding protein aMBF1 (putative translation factor)
MKCKICGKETTSSLFLCKSCKDKRFITNKDIDRSIKAVAKRFKINLYRNYKIKMDKVG